MIIGMIPMALGLGDGGEDNAPLGRAVIGGLLCATVAIVLLLFLLSCTAGLDTALRNSLGKQKMSHFTLVNA